MTTSTRTAQLITAARTAQGMNLREFGAALNISHQQAKNYEDGQAPDKARVSGWIESDVPWVKQLGLNIFGAQYAALIQAVLVPDTKRYALTEKALETK